MLVQLLKEVPITVYVVVTIGFAVTLEPVVALNPVAGLQMYVLAPFADSTVEPPMQNEVGTAFRIMFGIGFTITTTLSKSEHPLTSVIDKI